MSAKGREMTAERPMPAKSWYEDGLRFRCLGCGRCCIGEPGFVWVDAAEIAVLAAALHMETGQFEEAFVRSVGKKKSLVELPDGDCVFFDNRARQCSVYHARPAQCRTWPFWESNVRSRGAWEETRRACPGSGQGRLVDRHEIERQVALVRR
jgi:Fe-S-cluster containining protein